MRKGVQKFFILTFDMWCYRMQIVAHFKQVINKERIMSASEGGHMGNPRPAGQIMLEVLAEQCGAVIDKRKPTIDIGKKVVAEMLEAKEHIPAQISGRAERYKNAAEIFKKITASEFGQVMKEILDFLSSEEWKNAKEMLSESGEYIQIGQGNDIHENTVDYCLGGDGFFIARHVGGTVVTELIHDHVKSGDKYLLYLAGAFRQQYENREASFLSYVYDCLDNIADFAEEFSDKK